MENKKLELVMFSALFIALSILVFFVFRPFLHILALAAILSVLFHPLYERLIKAFHGSRSLVACILVIVALVFLIIPVMFLGLQVFMQAQSFFSLTHADQGHYVQVVEETINAVAQYFVPSFSLDIPSLMSGMLAFISTNIGNILSGTAYIIFEIFFLLLAFFFFLRDGTKMLDSFISMSPFEKEQNKKVIDSTSRMITSVIRGTLFVGLIRMALIIVAFYLLGIPNALLWGSLAGIIAVIPGLGTFFAIIPACLYLLSSGAIFSAIVMAILGILLFFLVDNLLSTHFFGEHVHVQPPFILFSILGGVIFFGPLGFIFGPIILSLFLSMVNIYKILVLTKK